MREAPGTRLVILSMHGTPGHVAQALRAGVCGYLLKDSAADELAVLLRAVMRGETYLSAGDLEAGRRRLPGAHVAPATAAAAGAPDSSDLDVLTPRQREILQLVAEGKSTKEVAQLLDLSVKTVETHRAQIMDRLGIHDLAGPGALRHPHRPGFNRSLTRALIGVCPPVHR